MLCVEDFFSRNRNSSFFIRLVVLKYVKIHGVFGIDIDRFRESVAFIVFLLLWNGRKVVFEYVYAGDFCTWYGEFPGWAGYIG